MASGSGRAIAPTPAATAVDVGGERDDDARDYLYGDGRCECCVSYGNMHLLCGARGSHFPFQIFVGPDWPCILFTLGLVCGMSYVWLTSVAAKLHVAVFAVGCASSTPRSPQDREAGCMRHGPLRESRTASLELRSRAFSSIKALFSA